MSTAIVRIPAEGEYGAGTLVIEVTTAGRRVGFVLSDEPGHSGWYYADSQPSVEMGELTEAQVAVVRSWVTKAPPG